MVRIMTLRYIITISLFLLLSSCTSPAENLSTSVEAPSPSAGSLHQSATAEQQSRRDTANGAITGVLVDENNQPISDIGVFLADLTEGPNGEGKIITFQLGTSKRGITDAEGKFTIEDIAPASYSLAIWTPSQSMLIPESEGTDGSAILVEVEAGRTTDVGTLQINRPD